MGIAYIDLTDAATHRWGPKAKWRCVYCGRSIPDGHVDHFIPRERGGTDLPWNLVPACGPCNRSKSAHDPLVWMRAVGLRDSTITALQTITRSPDWTRANDGYHFPTGRWPRYPAAIGLVSPYPALAPLPRDLNNLFMLDPNEWAPTTALRRHVAAYLEELGRPPLSTQQLSKLLEARGFVKTKRKGIYGYRGFHLLTPAGKLAVGRKVASQSRREESRRRAAANEVSRLRNSGD